MPRVRDRGLADLRTIDPGGRSPIESVGRRDLLADTPHSSMVEAAENAKRPAVPASFHRERTQVQNCTPTFSDALTVASLDSDTPSSSVITPTPS